ncbi:Phosphatase [Hyphomicrobiales bacterium]|nr:Phosphatase [Hyphomicrobiales bacterium]CAH1697780.1 Phosphatase [Hyphomicrobiales bacterium]CAI0347426.1 Phosphatase [Hyphomicrobiales bacterium]
MNSVQTGFMRRVNLPAGVAGTLWLGPMPGRLRPLADDLADLNRQSVARVICLTPMDEIASKAPDYAARQAELGFPVTRFPIGDFGVPEDHGGLKALAEAAARDLEAGRALFVHCAAGIGRTGMVATCILVALGLSGEAATATIAAAGSGPETDVQKQLVARYAEAALQSGPGTRRDG